MTKPIDLVVEGPTEKRFFEAMRSWFTRVGLDVAITPSRGRSQLIKDAAKHLSVHRKKGRSLVVFLLDQDTDECSPSTAATLRNVASHKDALVSVFARELEAWFLADTHAIVNATGQNYQCHAKTDELANPHESIRSVFYRARKQYLTKMEITKAVAARFSLDRAAENNDSAARFRSKLAAWAQDP